MKEIYFDNSTTARPSDAAISAMMPFLTDRWGDPSAPHQKGQSLLPAIRESYRAIYELFSADPQDLLLFTSSRAESIQHILFSVYRELVQKTGKNHFIIPKTEEAPLWMAVHQLKELGCHVTEVSFSSSGSLTAENIGDAITPRTAMLSLSWASGLTGVIHPIEEICALCKDRGILLHLDVTHILGKVYFEVGSLGADFVSFQGDQLHAPKGTGGIWVERKIAQKYFLEGEIKPVWNLSGTYNVPALVGLGAAAKEASESRDFFSIEASRLRDKLEALILLEVPDAVILFKDKERIPYCTVVAFPGVVNEALLYLLNKKGVFACMGGGIFQQIGNVLKASGIEEFLSNSALSFSLSKETTEEDIENSARIITECVQRLKKMSEYFFRDERI